MYVFISSKYSGLALSERLKLFEPSLKDIAECNEKHPLVLTPGIEELVKTLHRR